MTPAANPSMPAAAPADDVWRSPLVPLALAATAGIVLDRFASVPMAFSLMGAVAALAGWQAARADPTSRLPLLYLCLATVAVAAAYHHWRWDSFRADDVSRLAEAGPVLVELQGTLVEEPSLRHPSVQPLRTFQQAWTARTVLVVTHLRQGQDWLPASGKVALLASAASWGEGTERTEPPFTGIHAGDEVQAAGWLRLPEGPANPGQDDRTTWLRAQGIRAELGLGRGASAVMRLARGWPTSFEGGLAMLRARARRVIEQALPETTRGVAVALLLGDGSLMDRTDWDRYMQTGVVHVLAVSGQHLAIVSGVLWLVLRLLRVRGRRIALVVLAATWCYALLTGGQAPVVRAVVMVTVFCGGLLLRRPTFLANEFALAWLIVLLLNPTEVFDTGCQLSFLTVAVLYWGTRTWLGEPTDPLERLELQSMPWGERQLRWGLRVVLLGPIIIWLAVTPLIAARYHLAAPIALLLGPPVTLLATIALLSGFGMLCLAVVAPPLVPLLAAPTGWALAACEWLTEWGANLPGAFFYVADIPAWWLAVFYVVLLAGLMLDWLRRWWTWALPVGLTWVCVGLVAGAARLPADELRCTFLAVGHGACVVVEAPGGQTLVYDAGALSGPEVTARCIAPYLWSRGIRRVDDIILSHADLDHYNGLPSLLERFRVGGVTCTPSFQQKPLQAVELTVQAIAGRRIPLRLVSTGDRLTAGVIEIDVLHPPAKGPDGPENVRSLVLRLQHARHTILLTGDLEGAGLAQVLRLPGPQIDVLMAPHHGSAVANTTALADWARPRIVISCQGPARAGQRVGELYAQRGARFLSTAEHGAVTVRSHASGLVVETFKTGERFGVRR